MFSTKFPISLPPPPRHLHFSNRTSASEKFVSAHILCLARCLHLVCAVIIVHLLTAFLHLRIYPRSLIDKVCVCGCSTSACVDQCLIRIISSSGFLYTFIFIYLMFNLICQTFSTLKQEFSFGFAVNQQFGLFLCRIHKSLKIISLLNIFATTREGLLILSTRSNVFWHFTQLVAPLLDFRIFLILLSVQR